MPPSDIHDRVHVARLAGDMDRGFSVRGNRLLDEFGSMLASDCASTSTLRVWTMTLAVAVNV
jgi:hypothetical protein